MDKRIPEINWIIRFNPRREPQFHIYEIVEGVGKSTNILNDIFIAG